MSVNFTPEMKGYTGQGAFRFWCQAVLPLVYDDSLSYMELLNKMVIYLNNTIKDVAAMEENVDALYVAYNELQKYVNDYFDNLDVQEEINHKLDVMASDGSLDELLEPFVTAKLPGLVENNLPGVVEDQIDDVVADQIDDVVGEQIGDVVAEQIPSEVTDWLNDNVTPVGSAVVVDSSLTISGAAADAKVTGDRTLKLYGSTTTNTSLSDIPRNGYTYILSQYFAECPDDIPNGTYLGVIRIHTNNAGNLSQVFCFTKSGKPDMYVGNFSETETFRGWTKVGKASDGLQWFDNGSNNFSASSMPMNSHIYTTASNFTDRPPQITSTWGIYVEKVQTSELGNIATLTCFTLGEGTTLPVMFRATLRTSGNTSTLTDWVQYGYMTYYPTFNNAFGVSDMPRSSYTHCQAQIFTDCPVNISGSTYITIERENMNAVGNISRMRLTTRTTPIDVYVGYYSENDGFHGWTKITNEADLAVVSAEVDRINEDIMKSTYNLINIDELVFL